MARRFSFQQLMSIADQIEEVRADYRAGRDTRFQSKLTGVDAMGSGADYHYRNETQFLHMIERCRDYQRNDPIVGQALRRLVSNVVQTGFTLDVKTGDADVDSKLKDLWSEWSQDAERCHSEKEFSFAQIERMVLSSVMCDGDVFLLPLKNGSLQPIEAHRVRTPQRTKRNVIHGILLNDLAQRQEYWITKEDLDPWRVLSRVSDIRRVPAYGMDGERQVHHIYNPYRFSQRRGVPIMAPVADVIGMHDDTQFATLVKQQMAAMICILRSRDANYKPSGGTKFGQTSTETDNQGYTREIQGVGAGLDVAGEIGETLDAFSPQIPGPGYLEHSLLLLTFIAINLDMPVHMLLLDPSRTNFSGWRGAIDQARLRFREIQQWLVEKFHRPIYRWKVRQFVARSRFLQRAMEENPEINIFGHDWNPPSWPYLEPLTDASGDLLQQRNGLNSPRRIQANRGREWGVVAAEIVDDNALAIELAIKKSIEINSRYQATLGGNAVHWRELISLPTPDGINVSVTTSGYGAVTEGEETQTAERGAA